MKKTVAFIIALSLSIGCVFAQTSGTTPVNPSAITIRIREQKQGETRTSWDYYQGLTKISEAALLTFVGETDKAKLAELYQKEYEGEKTGVSVCLAVSAPLILAGEIVMISAPSGGTKENIDGRLTVGTVLDIAGIISALSGLGISMNHANKSSNFLSSKEAIFYVNKYNAKLSN